MCNLIGLIAPLQKPNQIKLNQKFINKSSFFMFNSLNTESKFTDGSKKNSFSCH